MVSHGMMNMLTVKDMCHRFAVSIQWVDRAGNVMELNVAIHMPFLHSKMLNINVLSMQCWMVLIDDYNGSFIVNVKASRTSFRETKIAEDHA